ncbi:hypothetical protein KI655_18700 [Vibrio sp. D404a]|uniref:hypothetical protein n=1 Tax=unclassified Vibrio TaxID=2614977 RepID=UPI00255485AE|nr:MULTISPECIES: hypothetical protein [unclassified Vibrio]MDK9739329.1 hypothetical protein [Vibrio sp. D404a]MDK9797636.1 hypothetical protein [Vibrio sp. D449a]
MNIVHIRDKALVTPENLEATEAKLKQQSFDRMTAAFGLTNLTIEEVMSCGEGEIFDLVANKYNELGRSEEPTPAETEELFLKLMARFREVGNRNMYGNNCAVFTPPSGYKYNEEVSNTYYYMYDNALEGSKMLTLWTTFVEKSAGYVIKGGPLSMFRWIKDVAVPVALEEWKLEQADDEEVLNPTLVYLINQNNQSALTVAYVFG